MEKINEKFVAGKTYTWLGTKTNVWSDAMNEAWKVKTHKCTATEEKGCIISQKCTFEGVSGPYFYRPVDFKEVEDEIVIVNGKKYRLVTEKEIISIPEDIKFEEDMGAYGSLGLVFGNRVLYTSLDDYYIEETSACAHVSNSEYELVKVASSELKPGDIFVSALSRLSELGSYNVKLTGTKYVYTSYIKQYGFDVIVYKNQEDFVYRVTRRG
jgi:hypothetical protein